MSKIKETAQKLKDKYQAEYNEWSKANPGYVMHGASIKASALQKAEFADSMDDLKAMQRTFQIEYKAAEGKPNGFNFMSTAITELIQTLENE